MRAEVEEAVGLMRRGDDASIGQALELLQNTVFSFSMRLCGHREDAEDTMQEVLMKSVPQLPKFDSPKALVVWLYKVAKNRCLMNRRKSKFAPAHELSLEELMPDRKELEQLTGDGRVNPEAFAIRSEQASRLREAVQKLPPQYRIVLVLRDMEGLTDDEVGGNYRPSCGNRAGPATSRPIVRQKRVDAEMEIGKQQKASRSETSSGGKSAGPLQGDVRGTVGLSRRATGRFPLRRTGKPYEWMRTMSGICGKLRSYH